MKTFKQVTEANSPTERQAWNKIASLLGDADRRGELEDIGYRKGRGKASHEFAIGDYEFRITQIG